MDTSEPVDFAISYAGEDIKSAKAVAYRLRELGFEVFLADWERRKLAGVDGEVFFEQLFSRAKQVIVFISRFYKEKEWPRFEWDIIRQRKYINRFLPIRLDDSTISGLSSKHIYIRWSDDNLSDIVDTCVEQLLIYEKEIGIKRASFYDQILESIREGNKGGLAKAYQLVKDKRKRKPLDDAEMPTGPWNPSYRIEEEKWNNYSVVKRRALKIRINKKIQKDELIYNLKHCCIKEFNELKPDAVSVCAYSKKVDLNGPADLGVIEFAPFGEWGKAEEGIAYNLPTSDFDFRIKLPPN